MKRPSYEKQQRERAKYERRGLITIDVVRTDGSRSTLQIVASDQQQRVVERVMLRIIKEQQ